MSLSTTQRWIWKLQISMTSQQNCLPQPRCRSHDPADIRQEGSLQGHGTWPSSQHFCLKLRRMKVSQCRAGAQVEPLAFLTREHWGSTGNTRHHTHSLVFHMWKETDKKVLQTTFVYTCEYVHKDTRSRRFKSGPNKNITSRAKY